MEEDTSKIEDCFIDSLRLLMKILAFTLVSIRVRDGVVNVKVEEGGKVNVAAIIAVSVLVEHNLIDFVIFYCASMYYTQERHNISWNYNNKSQPKKILLIPVYNIITIIISLFSFMNSFIATHRWWSILKNAVICVSR